MTPQTPTDPGGPVDHNRVTATKPELVSTAPYEMSASNLGLVREFALGTILKDRYLLEKELGRGGMGQVYMARDQLLHRLVAVKVIRPRDPDLRNRTIYEAGLREAFAEEAQIGANLTDPAIATVFDFGFHCGEPFIVFEYIQGQTLREVLQLRGRLPLQDVRLILGSLAQALDFAHSHHVVHRDLKPDNIRATGQGHFKILDLGLAKEFRQAVNWQFAGTPAYASPEQADGLPCDGRTDQYALALIAFEMLTGRRVFQHGDSQELLKMHRSHDPPSPQKYLPELPETVCSALLRALQKDPNRRFSTSEEFAVAMGCQLVAGPVPQSEILRLAAVRKMSGDWRSSRFGITRQGAAAYLVMGTDAIWVFYRAEIRRWPLCAIVHIERIWWGNKLCLRIQSGSKALLQSFHFARREECREWYEQLHSLKNNLPAAPMVGSHTNRVEPVVLMRHRPVMRYQSLGAIEFKDAKRRSAEVGLQVRAAMIGADAVVDVQQERLPEFRRTLRRVSGMAIRAVDSAGRQELRSRWFAAQASRIGSWMLTLIAVSFLGTLAGSFLLTALGIAGIGMPLSPTETISQRFASVAVVITLMHSWPLAIALLVRLLLWPQLLRPATLAILALGAKPIAGLLGWMVAAAMTGKWWGVIAPLLMLLDPINLGILVFAWFLCQRAWRAYREYRSLMPTVQQQVPPSRRAVGSLTLAASIMFAAVLGGYVAWGAYSYVSHSSFPGSDTWKEARALKHFNEGLAKMAQQPQEAEQIFRRALPLWQELTDAAHPRPEHRQNLAATYHNLGMLLVQRGKIAEAIEALRQALAHYDKLGVDFPAYQNHKKDRDAIRQILSQLLPLKPFLEDAEEHHEGLRLVALGQHIAAATVYRQGLERHEQRMNEFANRTNYVQLLAIKQNRLAWFLAMCSDPHLRNPEEAVELAKQAVEHAPHDGGSWNTMGAAYYRAGNFKESLAALETSMELRQGGDGFDWFLLAMVYHRLDKAAEARQALEKAEQWIRQAQQGQLTDPLLQMQWQANRQEAELLWHEAEELITAEVSKAQN